MELTRHARNMLEERGIPEDWLWRALENPDGRESGEDGNIHYTKAIHERAGRVLRVVVNADMEPNRIVTVFFDRRLRKRS